MTQCCINPSILSADFVNLEAELQQISNADAVHVDVMDNHFVPNLTLGLARGAADPGGQPGARWTPT